MSTACLAGRRGEMVADARKAFAAAMLALTPIAVAAQQPRPAEPSTEPPLARETPLPFGDPQTFEAGRPLPPPLRGPIIDESLRPVVVPSQRPPVADMRARAQDLALASPTVRDALQDRYSLLSSGWLEPGKDTATADVRRPYQLLFYSYSRNRPVKVVMVGDEVVEVTPLEPGVQPAESHEEVQAAAEIVRSDSRLREQVAGMTARGIETPSGTENRHLYLTFHRENSRRASFEATVDMTAGRVVASRALPDQ
jgi:hypothetical protein